MFSTLYQIIKCIIRIYIIRFFYVCQTFRKEKLNLLDPVVASPSFYKYIWNHHTTFIPMRLRFLLRERFSISNCTNISHGELHHINIRSFSMGVTTYYDLNRLLVADLLRPMVPSLSLKIFRFIVHKTSRAIHESYFFHNVLIYCLNFTFTFRTAIYSATLSTIQPCIRILFVRSKESLHLFLHPLHHCQRLVIHYTWRQVYPQLNSYHARHTKKIEYHVHSTWYSLCN